MSCRSVPHALHQLFHALDAAHELAVSLHAIGWRGGSIHNADALCRNINKAEKNSACFKRNTCVAHCIDALQEPRINRDVPGCRPEPDNGLRRHRFYRDTAAFLERPNTNCCEIGVDRLGDACGRKTAENCGV